MSTSTLSPPSSQASTTAERIAEELDAARRSGPLKQIQIPPCPDLLLRLRTALREADPDLTEVARIAGADVAMAATLLRAANGPMHAALQPVQTLGQALNRLGLQQTVAILTAFLLRHALPVKHPQLQRFWERSALRAEALRFIAEQLPGSDPEQAHLYGLFSHVGMPVLMQCVRGYAGTMVEGAARVDRSFVATENANHRTDHTVVGALVARAWHVPGPVMSAIRLHHDFDTIGSSQVEPAVQTLVAAGLLAEHLMRQREGLSPEADWENHGQAAMGWLGISEDELSDWDEELQRRLDTA